MSSNRNHVDYLVQDAILDFSRREKDSLKNNVKFGRVAMSLNNDQKL